MKKENLRLVFLFLMVFTMVITSCSKEDTPVEKPSEEEKPVEEIPDRGDVPLSESFVGAQSNVKTKQHGYRLYDGREDNSINRDYDYVVSYGIDIEKQEDGSPLIYLYIGESQNDFLIREDGIGHYNYKEQFIKFVPEITPIEGATKVEVKNKEIKALKFFIEGKERKDVVYKGNDTFGYGKNPLLYLTYTKVHFIYDTKTGKLDILEWTTYSPPQQDISIPEDINTYTYKNLPIDYRKKVTPFEKSQYKFVRSKKKKD